MTDNQIVEGLKRGDGEITQRYFYGYLRVAYCVYDQRYGLRHKTDMDFYSLAHDYYMRLLMGDWKQLEARREEVSLRTWLTNGFRFLILDRLKTYHPAGDDLTALNFDVPDDHFSEDVRTMLEEVIDNHFHGDRISQSILRMILINGYKSKEVADVIHVSPSAISQRYRQMMDKVIIPYFKHYYEAESTIMEVEFERDEVRFSLERESLAIPSTENLSIGLPHYSDHTLKKKRMDKKRITPDFIQELGDNEIFVFGSNLAGMHGGGAAYVALKKFGAKMGQGVGLQGQSYAIPTMQGDVETIEPYVDEFIDFARNHPELCFLVTRIGCGIAGFDAEDIAPLFEKAKRVENIALPRDFWEVLEG